MHRSNAANIQNILKFKIILSGAALPVQADVRPGGHLRVPRSLHPVQHLLLGGLPRAAPADVPGQTINGRDFSFGSL